MPLFFWRVTALSSGEEKGRHVLFCKMAYYMSGFNPFSPEKTLCNAGDGCVAFTKSKNEKSVPSKLELKMSCKRTDLALHTV